MRHPETHTTRASLFAGLMLGILLVASPAAATQIGNVVISEILYDANGNNNGRQWIEIYNGNATAVDLSEYSLAWGRNDLSNTVALSSVMLAPDTTFIIGGPSSGNYNGSPSIAQSHNFAPDLYMGNHASQEDAVALIFEPTSTVVHIVVYGGNGFVTAFTDEQGATAVAVDVSGLTQNDSLEYQGGGAWAVQTSPTPGSVPTTVPEPGTALLFGLGLCLLGAARRRR